MARSVTFNGVTKFTPGGLSRVNAQSLNPIGLSATGIVALLGEADGGPNEVVIIDDPALAKDTYRSGSLADAVRIAFDASGDPRIPGGAQRVLAYKTNQGTRSTLQLPGDGVLATDTATGASTTTVITVTVGGLTVNAHTGRWLKIGTETRRIVSNTATTITVSPGFSVAPTSGTVDILATSYILTSRDYGLHTSQIAVEVEAGTGTNTVVTTVSFEDDTEQSDDIGGNAFLELMYVGGAAVTNGSGPVTAATTTTVTVNVAAAPTLNQFANMVLEFADGRRRLIDSNTAADPTVITLNSAHALTAAEATALVGTNVTVRDVTAATASIVGANGVATQLTSTVAPVADDLAITFSPNMTLRQLVDLINSTTNYEASVPDGINQDTTLMKTFDFGTRATAVNVRFDHAISYNDNGTFRRDLQQLVDWYNSYSTLVSAARATVGSSEGGELPLNTGGVAGTVRDIALFLTGGTRGISSNTNFQTAFDALLLERAQHVIPLISEDLTNEGNGSTATFASVAAQLVSHVQDARTGARSERGGYIGLDGTLTELIAQAKALNDTDVHLFGQSIDTLNASGTLTTFKPWAMAVTAAGMRAGAPEVGTPLTFKYIKAQGIDNDASWDPKDNTDRNLLVQNGIMFAEPGPQSGFRFVRDMTTHLIDDNIAFMEGNTRDCVRYVAYDLRTFLENEFTGEKARPATVATIRERTAARCATYVTDGILVQSNDPENPDSGVLIPGFRRLRVKIVGNVATIKLEIFPATGITFILSDIFLQLPVLTG